MFGSLSRLNLPESRPLRLAAVGAAGATVLAVGYRVFQYLVTNDDNNSSSGDNSIILNPYSSLSSDNVNSSQQRRHSADQCHVLVYLDSQDVAQIVRSQFDFALQSAGIPAEAVFLEIRIDDDVDSSRVTSPAHSASSPRSVAAQAASSNVSKQTQLMRVTYNNLTLYSRRDVARWIVHGYLVCAVRNSEHRMSAIPEVVLREIRFRVARTEMEKLFQQHVQQQQQRQRTSNNNNSDKIKKKTSFTLCASNTTANTSTTNHPATVVVQHDDSDVNTVGHRSVPSTGHLLDDDDDAPPHDDVAAAADAQPFLFEVENPSEERFVQTPSGGALITSKSTTTCDTSAQISASISPMITAVAAPASSSSMHHHHGGRCGGSAPPRTPLTGMLAVSTPTTQPAASRPSHGMFPSTLLQHQQQQNQQHPQQVNTLEQSQNHNGSSGDLNSSSGTLTRNLSQADLLPPALCGGSFVPGGAPPPQQPGARRVVRVTLQREQTLCSIAYKMLTKPKQFSSSRSSSTRRENNNNNNNSSAAAATTPDSFSSMSYSASASADAKAVPPDITLWDATRNFVDNPLGIEAKSVDGDVVGPSVLITGLLFLLDAHHSMNDGIISSLSVCQVAARRIVATHEGDFDRIQAALRLIDSSLSGVRVRSVNDVQRAIEAHVDVLAGLAVSNPEDLCGLVAHEDDRVLLPMLGGSFGAFCLVSAVFHKMVEHFGPLTAENFKAAMKTCDDDARDSQISRLFRSLNRRRATTLSLFDFVHYVSRSIARHTGHVTSAITARAIAQRERETISPPRVNPELFDATSGGGGGGGTNANNNNSIACSSNNTSSAGGGAATIGTLPVSPAVSVGSTMSTARPGTSSPPPSEHSPSDTPLVSLSNSFAGGAAAVHSGNTSPLRSRGNSRHMALPAPALPAPVPQQTPPPPTASTLPPPATPPAAAGATTSSTAAPSLAQQVAFDISTSSHPILYNASFGLPPRSLSLDALLSALQRCSDKTVVESLAKMSLLRVLFFRQIDDWPSRQFWFDTLKLDDYD